MEALPKSVILPNIGLYLYIPMFMSMSFFMGNFYQSYDKTSSNLLRRNSLEFIPRATVKQEKFNI